MPFGLCRKCPDDPNSENEVVEVKSSVWGRQKFGIEQQRSQHHEFARN
jgi:hypothetical protein